MKTTIDTAAIPMRLVAERKRMTAVADVEMPVLTAEMVRDALEQTRR